ncbi:phytanoyl-CoA dioxygenase family protein [Paenibacillus kobensis]|uniref:hypothetical protein n=1 Tax=Paenibacillus kobensis TaxID=59841 RepID=UPI000FDB80AE|nr:hypothetical protein [Paenibacillus kobensis]
MASSVRGESGLQSDVNIDSITALMDIKGYVILDNVFKVKQLAEIKRLVNGIKGSELDTNGHIQFPISASFIDSHVAENPDILRVIESLLGNSCTLRVVAVNPGDTRNLNDRNICMGSTPILAEVAEIRSPCNQLNVFIPISVLLSQRNWVEIWPGSHAHPLHYQHKYGRDRIQYIAEKMPSVAVHVPVGSVLIRDSNLWYRERNALEHMSLELFYQR